VDPDGQSPASVIIKQITKYGIKEGIKKQGIKILNQRLGKYMTASMRKQFIKDLDYVANKLDDSWWEIGIELIPVIGDIYGASKGAKKLKQAYDAYQNLENKYVGMIANKLKGKAKKRFISNMRTRGVADSKKDYEYMGMPYKKGYQGHHDYEVQNFPEKITDPRNIRPMNRDEHLNVGHSGDFKNPSQTKNWGVVNGY